MILINGGVPIEFAGTEEPAAYGELVSIGGLGPSVNAKLSSTIADILQTKLSIHSSRFYIKFYDVQVYFLTSIPFLLSYRNYTHTYSWENLQLISMPLFLFVCEIKNTNWYHKAASSVNI